MDKEKVLSIVDNDKYYGIDDLRYNQKLGYLFSKQQFEEFLGIKDEMVIENKELFQSINLKTFNSKQCFYVNGKYMKNIKNEYDRILVSDFNLNQRTLFNRNKEDMLISGLFSEIEGTLNIENIPTTHKHVEEISKAKVPLLGNDIVIKNMLDAVQYILNEKPSFNRENLKKLYTILSKNSLTPQIEIKEGLYYRDDKVFVGGFEGDDFNLIEDCMNSLFEFVNDPENLKIHGELLPYICQYYILYIHPYFDYNGRTARMVSFWLNYIFDIPFAPYFMSEAINESKNDYYKGIVETRNTNNDLTYFLGYILETSIKFSFVYKNIECIRRDLLETGDDLTSSEWVYLKKILIHSPRDFFSQKRFLEYIKVQMSRQGASKVLSSMVNAGVLEKSTNRKGDVVYRVNQKYVFFLYRGLE